ACFSPTVPLDIQRAWGEAVSNSRGHFLRGSCCAFFFFFLIVKNGGEVARTKEDRRRATWFFCSGMSDPWVA
ncbi:hypothetical protein NEOLEDRAFT_1032495, partial [Neolentinus lepideus HHB14362 ss-1]